ncbi:glycine-rich protein HC1-like [Coffea eugenioides]|uniref:glycine-rich protein HC1-like n=1 Tax=Coffea eugenioides TaxID=49369 RepID=UPI000F6105AB|nr:glycine-rich protein HC1-like [Coffea eugenioides]
MGSKTLLLFFISLAIVLAITSQVAARELAEASTSVDNSETLDYPTAYGGGGGGGDPEGGGLDPGGGWRRDGGYGGGGGSRYGGYPGQAVDAEP